MAARGTAGQRSQALKPSWRKQVPVQKALYHEQSYRKSAPWRTMTEPSGAALMSAFMPSKSSPTVSGSKYL